MKRRSVWVAAAYAILCLTAGCGGDSKGDPKAEAPPQTKVEHEEDVNVVTDGSSRAISAGDGDRIHLDGANRCERSGNAGRVAHSAGGFAGNRARG